jgi:hypothetical protein
MQKFIVHNTLAFARGGLIGCTVPGEEFHLADGHRPLACQFATIDGITTLYAASGIIEANGTKELTLYSGKYNAAKRVFGSAGHLQSSDYAVNSPDVGHGITSIALRDYDISCNYDAIGVGLGGLVLAGGEGAPISNGPLLLLDNGPVWASVKGVAQLPGNDSQSVTSQVRVFGGLSTIEFTIEVPAPSCELALVLPGVVADAAQNHSFPGNADNEMTAFVLSTSEDAVCWAAVKSRAIPTVAAEFATFALPQGETRIAIRVLPRNEHNDAVFTRWSEAQQTPLAVTAAV